MTRVAAPTVPLQVAAQTQRGLAIRGALLLLFGLAEGGLVLFAFRLPHITVHELVIVLAVFMLADGGVALAEAAGAVTRRAAWLGLGGNALVSLAAGVAILVMGSPHGVWLFGAWAILTGLLEVGQVLAAPAARTPGRLLAAVISVVFGVFALAGPMDRASVMLVGAVFGVVAGGLRLRGAVHPQQIRTA